MDILLGILIGTAITIFAIFTIMAYVDRDDRHKKYSYIKYLLIYLIWEQSLRIEPKEKTTINSWGEDKIGIVESLIERGIKKKKAFKMMDEAKFMHYRDCIEVTFKDGTYEVYEHDYRTKKTWLNNDYLKTKI